MAIQIRWCGIHSFAPIPLNIGLWGPIKNKMTPCFFLHLVAFVSINLVMIGTSMYHWNFAIKGVLGDPSCLFDYTGGLHKNDTALSNSRCLITEMRSWIVIKMSLQTGTFVGHKLYHSIICIPFLISFWCFVKRAGDVQKQFFHNCIDPSLQLKQNDACRYWQC